MSNQPATSEGFDRSEPNVRLIAAFGAVTIVLLVVTVLGLQAYFDHVLAQEVYVKVLAPESPALTNLRAREDGELHSYRYIDRDKGEVQLPIERAMQLLAAEYSQGKLPYPTQPVPVPPELRGGSDATR
jgi:diphthamide biosynthesis methyltransferase